MATFFLVIVPQGVTVGWGEPLPAHQAAQGRMGMTPELPLCRRQCAHKQSQYIYPSWSHRCLKSRPMVEGCRWKTGHREPRNERQDY